jgi:hypothetical protein
MIVQNPIESRVTGHVQMKRRHWTAGGSAASLSSQGESVRPSRGQILVLGARALVWVGDLRMGLGWNISERARAQLGWYLDEHDEN